MATFPILRTGAVTQYPLVHTSGHADEVITFLDGSDQRFQMQGRMFRSWQIELELLTDSELKAVEDFFAGQAGSYSSFAFPDPVSGSTVPFCRFASDSLTSVYAELNRGSASFQIVETNG